MSTVIPLDRSAIPGAVRQAFLALTARKRDARQWTDVERGETETSQEYWVVYLPGGESPSFDWTRGADGRYVVQDYRTRGPLGEPIVLSRPPTDAGLLALLERLP